MSRPTILTGSCLQVEYNDYGLILQLTDGWAGGSMYIQMTIVNAMHGSEKRPDLANKRLVFQDGLDREGNDAWEMIASIIMDDDAEIGGSDLPADFTPELKGLCVEPFWPTTVHGVEVEVSVK